MGMLVDLIPARQRKYVYAVVAAGVFVYGVWQAADGNWTQFAVSLVTSLSSTLATANTDVKDDSGE